jgi:manganese/zinc/iron transport system permease protein
MTALGPDFVQFSLTPILIGILAAIACALPGNFLILRRQALIGDAISHVVLPGIVAAFLITGSLAAIPMLLGAAGAAMGVTFTALFAAGVLLLEQSDTSSVHLDVEHALMGNLESLVWLEAEGWASLIDPAALAMLPPELARIAAVAAFVSVLLIVFWRPLAIATFDEPFAATLGLPTALIGFALVVVSAIAAVAAFDAVGSIIVIAMFICPPAAARLMTDRLHIQVWWSVAFASLAAILGYVFAGYGPLWFGVENAVSAAGMIATVSGLILALACLFGPRRTRTGRPGETAA